LVALVLAEAKAVEDVLGVHQVLPATFVMDRRHLPIDSASVETAVVALAILVDMVVHLIEHYHLRKNSSLVILTLIL
jgi:hypothetical protein